MTRRSKRELERGLDDLEPDHPGEGPGPDVVIRHTAVDADGDPVGVTREVRAGPDADGTWSSETRTFDVPNDRTKEDHDSSEPAHSEVSTDV